MTTTSRRVPPSRQPLRPAIALVVLTVLSLLLTLIGYALQLVAGDLVLELLDPAAGTTALVVSGVLALLAVGLVLGTGLASLILAIIVAVRGDGKLRVGAFIVLGVRLLGSFASFTVSGDLSSLPAAAQGTADLFSLLSLVLDVVLAVATLVGAVLLVQGIGEVRRARAQLPPG